MEYLIDALEKIQHALFLFIQSLEAGSARRECKVLTEKFQSSDRSKLLQFSHRNPSQVMSDTKKLTTSLECACPHDLMIDLKSTISSIQAFLLFLDQEKALAQKADSDSEIRGLVTAPRSDFAAERESEQLRSCVSEKQRNSCLTTGLSELQGGCNHDENVSEGENMTKMSLMNRASDADLVNVREEILFAPETLPETQSVVQDTTVSAHTKVILAKKIA